MADLCLAPQPELLAISSMAIFTLAESFKGGRLVKALAAAEHMLLF